MIKLFLSSQSILNKTFPATSKGYSPIEVDEFLDKIIEDYRLIESNHLVSNLEINSLNDKIADLEKNNQELAFENEKLKNRMKGIELSNEVNQDNISLLKRISALEKFLWQHGYNPEIIK